MGDVFEETEEGTITIGEYIKEVEDQELEADLVLGGDEGKECTYYNGYMKRQAIFSCLTCTPNGNAGVCTACSLACHDGHEIVELWTKRKFRCDCGNSKFGEFFCKLYANKDIENIQNSYNQNFKGLYCTCARPYPDLEVEEQVEMIQCCICEDWFHEDHLGLDPDTKIPRDEEGEPCYEDFICKDCSSIFSFLTLYPQHIWAMSKESGAPKNINCKDEEVNDPSSSSSRKLDNNICLSDISKGNGTPIDNVTNGLNENYSAGESSDRVLSFNPEANKTVSDKKCLIGFDLYKASLEINENKPMFMSKNWRLFLCKCSGCEEFYSQKGINYLIDAEDSIGEYEKIAKQKREEKLRQQEGVELTFLEKLGHVQKIEILNGIAEMKNELLSFLESFDRTKSVTSEDVQHVFENLAKKRQRLM